MRDEQASLFERHAFRSFWNDGLLDLMLGLVVLVVGLSWWQGVPVYGALFPAVCVSLWQPLRRRLVEPRMGWVEFSGPRELRWRGFRMGLAAFFLGTAVLGAVVVLTATGASPGARTWIAAMPLVLLAVPAALFALFTACRRFLLYAALLLLVGAVAVVTRQDPHTAMITAGLVITLSGAVLLARFLALPATEPPE